MIQGERGRGMKEAEGGGREADGGVLDRGGRGRKQQRGRGAEDTEGEEPDGKDRGGRWQ
jgi:hypothetical protein